LDLLNLRLDLREQVDKLDVGRENELAEMETRHTHYYDVSNRLWKFC
jgi:hypothetical protein